jgi:hypothetical protein
VARQYQSLAQRPGFTSTHILFAKQRIAGIGKPYSTSAADVDPSVDNCVIRLVDIAGNADNVGGAWLTVTDWRGPDMAADRSGSLFGACVGLDNSGGVTDDRLCK